MKIILKVILPILLIAISFIGSKALITAREPLQSKQVPSVVPKVSTITVNIETHSPPIHTYGTVKSFFETQLTPQVSGEIISISKDFRVGKSVTKGTFLAQIDTTDYQAILSKEAALLSNYERTLEEEIIRAEQANQDWLASGRKLDSASSFVLRKPQLSAAKANIASSKASIKKAQADIDRCTIKAPFDAVVSQRSASLGNYATAQSTLGTLVATEHAEIRLPLTPAQVQRIQLPTKDTEPTAITLTSPTKPQAKWQASLTRTEPIIDPRNQVVFVIAEIASPYDCEVPLPVGTFVNASIPAAPVNGALKIPEAALINDSYLWAVDKKSTLVRLPVSRIYSFQKYAYVTPNDATLRAPFTIVSRPLTNFRQGMKVQFETRTQ